MSVAFCRVWPWPYHDSQQTFSPTFDQCSWQPFWDRNDLVDSGHSRRSNPSIRVIRIARAGVATDFDSTWPQYRRPITTRCHGHLSTFLPPRRLRWRKTDLVDLGYLGGCQPPTWISHIARSGVALYFVTFFRENVTNSAARPMGVWLLSSL